MCIRVFYLVDTRLNKMTWHSTSPSYVFLFLFIIFHAWILFFDTKNKGNYQMLLFLDMDENLCNIFHNVPPGNNFTVSWPELHWRHIWVNDASPACYTRMQTHHLSHRVSGQRSMWATVTCLKVTPPDKSNLFHWHWRFDGCVSHLFGYAQSKEWDWWGSCLMSCAHFLSVCLLLELLGIYLR